MSTEQPPEWLDVAVSHIEELGSIIATRYADHTGKVHPLRLDRVIREVSACNDVIAAIRSEHAQRLTLQHHAADQAQRIADLEAKCVTLKELHDAAAAERDALRARLDVAAGQEPVAWATASFLGFRTTVEKAYGLFPGCTTPLYARPAPAPAQALVIAANGLKGGAE